jgi:hypothetical protein
VAVLNVFEGGSSMSNKEPPISLSEKLEEYDELMEAFSFAIDKAMRDQLLDKPQWLRCQVMLTVLASYWFGSLNECPTLEQKWVWADLMMHHLRRLGPPEPE